MQLLYHPVAETTLAPWSMNGRHRCAARPHCLFAATLELTVPPAFVGVPHKTLIPQDALEDLEDQPAKNDEAQHGYRGERGRDG